MSSSDYLQYKLFYDNWEKINSFQTNYLNDFFIGPLFSNGYTSYTENNFYSGTHESLSKWFDTASLSRPLDIVIDTLVLCADVNSISTYLAAIQSLEPTEFVFAISFIDHIDSSLSEWSLYYENDIDEEELSILQVIPNVDASLLGFLSFCDEFFYFDIIDFFSAPDAIKLYDSYAGIVLSIIDETFELEDELEDAESEDEDFHYEADDEHTWFFYLKTVDTITRNFSSYLSFLDFFFFKNKLPYFFFHKESNWASLQNYLLIEKSTNSVIDTLVLNDRDNHIGVAQIFVTWFFWLLAWPFLCFLTLLDLELPFFYEISLFVQNVLFAFIGQFLPVFFKYDFYLYTYAGSNTMYVNPNTYDEDIVPFIDTIFDAHAHTNLMITQNFAVSNSIDIVAIFFISTLLNLFYGLCSIFFLNLKFLIYLLFIVGFYFILKAPFIQKNLKNKNYMVINNSYFLNLYNYFILQFNFKKKIYVWY